MLFVICVFVYQIISFLFLKAGVVDLPRLLFSVISFYLYFYLFYLYMLSIYILMLYDVDVIDVGDKN